MNISMRKVWAITEVKAKSLFGKNFITMPLFTLGIIFILRMVFESISEGETSSFMIGYLLNFGLVFNICVMGIYTTSAALAEEKEKHTLRTLMTSSVNGYEFFLGSILPVFLMMMFINVLMIPVSGCAYTDINLFVYILVCTIASLTSCILGMILGIFAKNQVSASTIATPALLLFTFIPTFSTIIESLKGISQFLFTGVIADMVNAISTKTSYELGWLQITVLVSEIVLAIVVFLYFYKKNGYEAE